MPNVTHTVAPSKKEYISLVFAIIDPAFLGHGNKIVFHLTVFWGVGVGKMAVWLWYYVRYTPTYTHINALFHHLPGVGLLWTGPTNESPDVSVCVECVELKWVGEIAAVKRNRATHLKLCGSSFEQPLYSTYTCTCVDINTPYTPLHMALWIQIVPFTCDKNDMPIRSVYGAPGLMGMYQLITLFYYCTLVCKYSK